MNQTAIDTAHADLLYGLIVAFKPAKILELGLGLGTSAAAIIRAISFNENWAKYTIVDDWCDFYGVPQRIVGAELITKTEKDFVIECLQSGRQFDFIFSDADHANADKWFDETYGQILTAPGILIYHDIDAPDFTNLKAIHRTCEVRNITHVLFNRESREDERCSRGLLVIFKK